MIESGIQWIGFYFSGLNEIQWVGFLLSRLNLVPIDLIFTQLIGSGSSRMIKGLSRFILFV